MDLPIDRFLSTVYFWVVGKLESQEELDKLNARLWQPPKGEAPEAQSIWSPENETKAFAAFQAQVTGKTREGATLAPQTGGGEAGQ